MVLGLAPNWYWKYPEKQGCNAKGAEKLKRCHEISKRCKIFQHEKSRLKRWYERRTAERIIREWRVKIAFPLYLHTCLVAGFLPWELGTFFSLESLLCSHSAIKHLNMLQMLWEGALKFHLRSLIIKKDPGNIEPIFSLVVLIPWHLCRDARNRWWWSGGGSFVVSRAGHPPLQRWDKKRRVSISHPASQWVVISPQSSVVR